MNSVRYSPTRIGLLTAFIAVALSCSPSFAQQRLNSDGGSNASGAVNEYEAFRIWRERTGRTNATYQDYLESRDGRGGRGVDPGYQPPPQRRPVSPPPESRRPSGVRRTRRPVAQAENRRRQPRRPLRSGPLHEDCRSHLNGYDRFTEFPCIIERACKKCPTTTLFYASSYEFDKYDRLDKIRYHRSICPNCRYENRLTIRLKD